MRVVCNLQSYQLLVSWDEKRGLFICKALQETRLQEGRGSLLRSGPGQPRLCLRDRRASRVAGPHPRLLQVCLSRCPVRRGELGPRGPTGHGCVLGASLGWDSSQGKIGKGVCLAEATLSRFIFKFENSKADWVSWDRI